MDEVIKMVVQKTGISESQARSAVETVANFLKTKLPAPLAGQVDQALQGNTSGLGGITQGLGGFLGKS